jgi:BirA family biotin operon repressor/biotin-[acetyl-CoA-carboxylase] ligase
VGIKQAQLKWPNDILCDYRKLAGILIELQGDMEGPSAAVIGIGLNLHLPEHVQKHIDQAAVDMHSLARQPIDPSTLLGTLLKHLALVLNEFETQGFEHLREEWVRHHAYQQQQVRMLLPDGREMLGVVNGIAPDGVLLVETASGLQRFSAGEISLRGVHP